jgi:hypothetical protein
MRDASEDFLAGGCEPVSPSKEDAELIEEGSITR